MWKPETARARAGQRIARKGEQTQMMRVNSTEDLIDELDMLRAYGVSVSEAAYAQARQVDIRLYSLLDRREAALLVLRRAASLPTGKDPRPNRNRPDA